MQKRSLLLTFLFAIGAFSLIGQENIPGYGRQGPGYGQQQGRNYLLILDDAQFDVGFSFTAIFALDDRASLASNPHFRAMWNLVRLGAQLESLLNGMDEPLNDMDLGREFGKNGYNKTIPRFFLRYGFGESTDGALQRHFFELSVGPGYFKQGNGGTNIHFDYQMNLFKTAYGAGAASVGRSFDHEIFIGGRLGYDWSFRRSESEAGFFTHLNDELERIALENEFTASQLIMLEKLAEDSRILLPEDVGGRTFHAGVLAGGRVSKEIVRNIRVFLEGQAFYDMMDLTSGRSGEENMRSQHHISLSLGATMTIGSEGEVVTSFF